MEKFDLNERLIIWPYRVFRWTEKYRLFLGLNGYAEKVLNWGEVQHASYDKNHFPVFSMTIEFSGKYWEESTAVLLGQVGGSQVFSQMINPLWDKWDTVFGLKKNEHSAYRIIEFSRQIQAERTTPFVFVDWKRGYCQAKRAPLKFSLND